MATTHASQRPQLRSTGLATKRRLLEAATEEFAQHGIAGARVDRIVQTAGSNKSQLYAYFGSKEQLFDAVLTETVNAFVDAAPLDADDLPGYAVALYDAYLARPEMVRLAAWNRLERRPEGELFAYDEDLHAGKLEQIAAAQAGGLIDASIEPADLLALVVATATTWSPLSLTVAGAASEPAEIHDRRRRALATAVRHAFAGTRR